MLFQLKNRVGLTARSKQRLMFGILPLIAVVIVGSQTGAQDRTITLPPITMTVDSSEYAKTKATGQSEIRNIRSTKPNVATAREWGTNDIQINAKQAGVTTIRFWDRANHTYYQVTVTVTPKPPRPEPTPPPKPPGDGVGKKPGPIPPPKIVNIDKCLVGTWRSEQISADVSAEPEGGSGILLTFKADGEVTIDYNEMKPFKKHETLNRNRIQTTEWTGKATAHISIDKDKVIKVEKVDASDIQAKITYADGRTGGGKISQLGPVGPGLPPNLGYTCDETTLTYQAFLNTITFKKVK